MIRVLIVEDEDSKAERVRDAIVRSASSPEITRVRTVYDAGLALELEQFDLMVVDVILPLRSDCDPVGDGGVQLIQGILKRPETYKCPTHIVGLTAYDPVGKRWSSAFKDKLLHLLIYDPASDEWALRISSLVRRLPSASEEQQDDLPRTASSVWDRWGTLVSALVVALLCMGYSSWLLYGAPSKLMILPPIGALAFALVWSSRAENFFRAMSRLFAGAAGAPLAVPAVNIGFSSTHAHGTAELGTPSVVLAVACVTASVAFGTLEALRLPNGSASHPGGTATSVVTKWAGAPMSSRALLVALLVLLLLLAAVVVR